MRNLSYRETGVALVLITASCVASYQLWFGPALAQIERDRRTLESLVASLATRPTRSTPAVASAPPLPAAQAIQAPLSPAPGAAKPKERARERSVRRRPQANEPCDARDPLCDSLEL